MKRSTQRHQLMKLNINMAKSPPTGPGKQSLTINYQNFLEGMGTSDNSNDAGFSPLSSGINLFTKTGQIASTAVPNTGMGGGIANQILMTCHDESLGQIYALDSVGKFYKSNGSGGNFGSSLAQDSTNSYASYYSDFVDYAGKFYTSSWNQTGSGDNVCQYDGVSTVVVDWFHTNFVISTVNQYLQLLVPHPMLVFNKMLYIADGKYLHKFDAATTSYVPQVLILSTGSIITALTIDPYSGQMLVAYSSQEVIGNTVPSSNKVGLYDGTNPTQFQKIVPTDDLITTFYVLGGQVFVFYGNNVGVWNGNGVTFWRVISTGVSSIVNKQMVTNLGNDLYYMDGANIVVYTEVLGGQNKVFWNIYNIGSTNISNPVLFQAGSGGLLGLAWFNTGGTYIVSSININNAGPTSQSSPFYSNHYYFPRRVWIRAIDVIMGSTVASGSHTFSFIDAANTTKQVGVWDSTITGQYHRFYYNMKTLALQVLDTIQSATPLTSITVYYDFLE